MKKSKMKEANPKWNEGDIIVYLENVNVDGGRVILGDDLERNQLAIKTTIGYGTYPVFALNSPFGKGIFIQLEESNEG